MNIETYYTDNYNTFCKRFVGRAGSYENAEDIIQEAFARALKYSDSFDSSKREFGSWFNTICTNALRDFKNTEKMQGMSISFDETGPELLPEPFNTEKLVVKKEIHKRIMQKEESTRTVLDLYLYKGYMPSDIVAVTEHPRGTILSIIARFTREMKDWYKIEENK